MKSRFLSSGISVTLIVSVLVFGAPAAPALASTVGGSHKGAVGTASMPFVADDNTCETFTDIDGDSSSDFAYEASDILRTASGVVKNPAGGVVANAIVTSYMVNWQGGDGAPALVKMSCTVTDSQGAFTSLDVLKGDTNPGSKYGRVLVAPPRAGTFGSTQLASKQFYVDPEFVGNTSVLVSPQPNLAVGDITLQIANNAAAFGSQNQQFDMFTGPTNIVCLSFDADGNSENGDEIEGGCSLARGLALPPANVAAMKTTTANLGGTTYNVVRFYWATDPGLPTGSAGPFQVTNLPVADGTSPAAFNGRWSGGTIGTEDPDGAGAEFGTLKYVQATYGNSPAPSNTVISFAATTPAPQLSAQSWVAYTHIPGQTTYFDETNNEVTVNLTDGVSRPAAVMAFSRNRIRTGSTTESLTGGATSEGVLTFTVADGSHTFKVGHVVSVTEASNVGHNVTNLRVSAITASTISVRSSATGTSTGGTLSGGKVESNSRYTTLGLCKNSDGFVISGCTPYLALTTSASSQTWGRNFLFLSSTAINSGSGCGNPGSGNFQALVVTDTSAETPLTGCGYINATPFSATAWGGSPGWDYQNEAGRRSSSVATNGRFGFAVPSSGVYNVEFSPNPGSTFTRTSLVFRFVVSGSEISSVQTCDNFSLSSQVAGDTDTERLNNRCTTGWTTIQPGATSARYLFLVRPANFFAKVLKPNGDPVQDDPNTSPAYEASWVDVQRLQASGGGFNFIGSGNGAHTETGGLVKLRLSTGSYKIVANNPQGAAYPELSKYLKVTLSSGNLVFQTCTTFNQSAASIDEALSSCSTVDASTSNPLVLQFGSADFTGQVEGKSNFWVQVEKPSTNCSNCWEWVGGSSANSNGVFAINFATAGTYRLTINPPWNDTSGATRKEVTVVHTKSPLANTVTGCNPTNDACFSGGVYKFTFGSANFLGTAMNGSNPEPFANVSFELFNADTQNYEWSNKWSNADAQGRFGATLENGTWKMTVRPGQANEGTLSPSTAYVVIAANEVSGGVATTQACAGTTGVSGCSASYISAAAGRYPISFGAPNFSGVAAVSSSSSRSGSGAVTNPSDAVSFSWMEVQVWNEFEQQYRWSPTVPGINTSSTGRFATTLPAGDATTNAGSKYQIILNPRPTDASSNRSRGAFKLFVDTAAGNAVKCQSGTSYNFCTYATPGGVGTVASGRFDLYLGGANLTGSVTAGGTNVANGQVRAERWNGQWFDWVNLWAQTGSNGQYALNLETDGIYKLTGEAPSWNNTYAGFANVSRYVKVVSGNLCVVDDQNDETCNATASSTLTVALPLLGANVRGTVSSASGTVSNSWVNVLKYNSVLGWWEWASGSPVNQSGQFSLSLAPTEDGDKSATGTQQRFKLEFMPPWGNSSLTRKEVQLWVGDVGQTSGDGANFYRECSETAISSCTGFTATPPTGQKSGNKATPDSLAVTLTAGNVSGKVISSGETGMANAWINVEKWTTPSWARSPMWQWVEVNANANSSGNYNLNLEPQGAGVYRITANPGWNNPNNLTRTSVVVKQAAGGAVCRVDNETDDSCNDSASTTYTLNITLTGANLVGTLKNGSSAVGFAWVGLMREQNGSALAAGDSRASTWYEWLGGSNTSATGAFALQLASDGRYQLEINPPWGTTLTKFSVYLLARDGNDEGTTIEAGEIYLCESKSQSNTACLASATIWSAGTNSERSFPTSNVAIRVCDKDDTGATCTPVPNAWVVVFSGFEWVSGATTNNLGVARFSLANGTTYKFEANPNWANPDGSRVETATGITVAGGTLDLTSVTVASPVIAKSAGQIDIRLGSPNVSGSVFYQVGSSQTAMAWSYVGVRKNNADSSYTWLPGAPVDGTGAYKLSLEQGNYTLTAYPNPNIAERAPVSITVSVAANLAATCTGGVGSDSCSFDFDAAPKNVTFTMTGMGTLTRALYIYSGSTLVSSIAKAPSGGSIAMSFALGNGTYTLRVQALNTVKADGTGSIVDFDGATGTACRTHELIIASNVVSDQTALNTWASSFNGDDSTTGLECAA